MIKVSMLEREILNVQQQLQLMTLHPKKRTRILGRLSRYLAKQNKKNIRENKDPNGRSWQGRSSGSKKMMRKMSKQLKTKANSNEATLYFPGLAGTIASKHQHGATEKWNAAKAKKEYGKPDYDAAPTRLQAKRLRGLGYTIATKRKGKRKKPSIKWIIDNLTTGQAGFIINELKKVDRKSSWDVKLPKRQLLGVNPKDVTNFIATELEKEQR